MKDIITIILYICSALLIGIIFLNPLECLKIFLFMKVDDGKDGFLKTIGFFSLLILGTLGFVLIISIILGKTQ